MLPQQETALETCQHVHTILREVEQAVLVPGTDMLAQWETELGQAAALLEGIHESMKSGVASGKKGGGTEFSNPTGDSAIRPALQEIRRATATLQAKFEHGSNYCMGLLQVRLGTGYSEHGLPVLMPTEARGTFEG
jgi:hypothetical protein